MSIGNNVPLFELGVDHSVGEALTTDPNAFQYAITLQLVQYELGVEQTCIRQQPTASRYRGNQLHSLH